MATLYENFTTGDADGTVIYGAVWDAQTITVGAANHTITSVKIKAYRKGSPGTVTAHIRVATSGSPNKPTGGDLTTGTIDGNSFTDNVAGAWYEIPVTEITLTALGTYAIVISATGGDVNNCIYWRYYNGDGYADGNWCQSTNNDVSWTGYTAYDALFEVWGAPPITSHKIYVRYVHLVKMICLIIGTFSSIAKW